MKTYAQIHLQLSNLQYDEIPLKRCQKRCFFFFLLRNFLTLQFARCSVPQRVYKIAYALFLSRIFRTFQFARSFCCGFFRCFSLHVIFVADFPDVSVCTFFLWIFPMLQFARRYFCRGFFGVSVCTTFVLLRIFRTLQLARRDFCRGFFGASVALGQVLVVRHRPAPVQIHFVARCPAWAGQARARPLSGHRPGDRSPHRPGLARSLARFRALSSVRPDRCSGQFPCLCLPFLARQPPPVQCQLPV